MTRSGLCFLFLLSVAPALPAMAKPADPLGAESSITAHQLRGVLRGYDSGTHLATIAHEEVPGYMKAMTMAFEVREPSEIVDLRPGDVLEFRLCVAGEQSWIDAIRKTAGQAEPLFEPAPAETSREMQPGDILPDIEVSTAEGRRLRLSDFRGKALVLAFIYTRCPLPDYCPLVSRHLETAQTLLEGFGELQRWQFLSLSIDAESDTPEILAAYARKYRAQPEHWIFANARPDSIRMIGKAVGLTFIERSGSIEHNLRVVVVDATGRIQHIFRGNKWTPQELVSEIRSAVRPGS